MNITVHGAMTARRELTVQRFLYTLVDYPPGPIVGVFHSKTSYFLDSRLLKIEKSLTCTKCPPQSDIEHLTVKCTLIHQVLTAEAQIFALRSVVFEIQDCRKSKKKKEKKIFYMTPRVALNT